MLIKILVVDDDPQVLNSLGKIFTSLLKGYLVLKASSANEGLSMLKEQKPDIVIVDVRLGPESGMDLIADYYTWIKESGTGYKPVFIVITAYDDEQTRQKAEEFKVDAFLTKPFSKETILHAVINGICKILRGKLEMMESMRNQYKQIAEKIKDADEKLNSK